MYHIFLLFPRSFTVYLQVIVSIEEEEEFSRDRGSKKRRILGIGGIGLDENLWNPTGDS